LGWQPNQLERRQFQTNVDQYKGMCGVHPGAAAQLTEDLQTTKVAKARIEKMDVEKLHWALHFLYRYPRETEQTNTWKRAETPYGLQLGITSTRLEISS